MTFLFQCPVDEHIVGLKVLPCHEINTFLSVKQLYLLYFKSTENINISLFYKQSIEQVKKMISQGNVVCFPFGTYYAFVLYINIQAREWFNNKAIIYMCNLHTGSTVIIRASTLQQISDSSRMPHVLPLPLGQDGPKRVPVRGLCIPLPHP